jgi:hypothetical protein
MHLILSLYSCSRTSDFGFKKSARVIGRPSKGQAPFLCRLVLNMDLLLEIIIQASVAEDVATILTHDCVESY